jgi:hypothetical protein
MLLARSSCRFGILTPALLHILSVLEEYAHVRDLTIIVLSGTDGGHTLYSGHAEGLAVDFRCRYVEPREFIDELHRLLGPPFAASHEHSGQSNEHYHVQLRRGVEFRPVLHISHVTRV